MKSLAVVTHIPVSKDSSFHILADGDLSREGMERLVANLQLQIAEGAYDAPPTKPKMINELATTRCRFGCDDGVAVIVEFTQGCVCFPDRIQALCMQHWVTAEPLGPCRVLYGKELRDMNILSAASAPTQGANDGA